MKIYFKFKFTGLTQNTTPISMAFLSEDGKKFYGEFIDYNRSMVDKYTKQNVINKLWATTKTISELNSLEYFHIGTKEQLKSELETWLSQFDDIVLVGDTCHYDMILFCELFGGALNIPSNVVPLSVDIEYKLIKYLCGDCRFAFNINRRCLCELDFGLEMRDLDIDNAADNVEIIKVIDEKIDL